jgi:hypothetical protein
MPTEDCWATLGKLQAQVDTLERSNEDKELRIKALESDRVRLTTLGGIVAFLLTGIGVFFADPIKRLILGLFSN